MSRTRIKICGITREEDALAAANAGADAIGLILHADAPRGISLESAKRILQALPPMVSAVGVFVDAPVDLIKSYARELSLRYVQLHGNEPPELIVALDGLRVIKALRPHRAIDDYQGLPNLSAVLIETHGLAQGGGTGIESDWKAIASLRKSSAPLGRVRLIAAGGLRAENVGGVIEMLDPWAVDVSSGVESATGVKSASSIEAFCRAVREADDAGA